MVAVMVGLQREVDDDFDVAGPPLERLMPSRERYAPRDQRGKPGRVGPLERLRRHAVMRAVGVDRPEHHIVAKHQRAVEAADVETHRVVGAEPEQADDAAWGRAFDGCGDDAWRAG